MRATLRTFKGVAHRLEIVAEHRGVQFVNDSIATAPERSMAALHAFDEPVVLIAGGRDKHLPMDEWAQLIVRKARGVVLLGEMSSSVREALARADSRYGPVVSADTMDQAVSLAAGIAQIGDVVLLSPGGTSFDRYVDFEQRGADFRQAVAQLGANRREDAA
jgi:UDP-N-acetylmuramoylalanine--D-glutamate ligase